MNLKSQIGAMQAPKELKDVLLGIVGNYADAAISTKNVDDFCKSIDNIQSLNGMKMAVKELAEIANEARTIASDANTISKQSHRNKQTKAMDITSKAKQVLGQYIRQGNHNETISGFAGRKALDTVVADVTIEEVVSRELSERAIANSVVLSQFRAGSLPNGSPYSVPKIATRPTVVQILENRNGDVIPATDNQTYTETVADFSKAYSMPAFTHEAIADSVRDVEADALRLISEELQLYMIAQSLFGDKDNNATDLRGLLTNRIDSANSYAIALQEDDVRDPEYLKVIKTGAANALPADVVNFLIDVQQDLSFKYQANAKWFMSRDIYKQLRKLTVGTDDARPLIINDFGSFNGNSTSEVTLLGKPVVIVDQLDETHGTANDIALFYGDLQETLEFGPLSGPDTSHFIVDEVTIKGQKLLYQDMRMFSCLHENDALRVVVQAA
ncbi:phage major capsid protein [Vibrio rotiferianus]|uniref:phage major capsid protein n=1 Tax=Vibrio rotiferianus TaxID=190895 RepID=UPI00339556FA